MAVNSERAYRGIWLRILRDEKYKSVSLKDIEVMALGMGLTGVNATEGTVGVFIKIPAILLNSNEGKACYPRVLPDQIPKIEIKKSFIRKRAAVWESVDWFEPPYVMMKVTNPIIESLIPIINIPGNGAESQFDQQLLSIYTLRGCAISIEQLFKKSRILEPHRNTLREAFLSYFSGYKSAAIGAVIPIVESSINELLSASEKQLTMHDRVDWVINKSIQRATSMFFDARWAPREISEKTFLYLVDERIYMFETLRRWLKESFFAHTKDYKGHSGLNRHIFAHGLSTLWQKPTNFYRLLGVLEALTYLEGWVDENSNVGGLYPDEDDNGKLLWQEAIFRTEIQLFSQQLMAERYHKFGRISPELTLDDGWHLRAAKLSSVAMKEIAKPLARAGWNVKVSDPIKPGEYILVDANSGDRKMRVSLLYSCATSNEVYKELDSSSQFILYMGAPDNQEAYTYGIRAHVGPIDTWKLPTLEISVLSMIKHKLLIMFK